MSKNTVLEQAAIDMAGFFYETARSQGGFSTKHKTAKAWIKANFEKFIPYAVDIQLGLLNRPDISDTAKLASYDAILERANDRSLDVVDNPLKVIPFFPDDHVPTNKYVERAVAEMFKSK